MKADDIDLLINSGFRAEVINILIGLGYQLDHHDPVTEVIEVSAAQHGFAIHRNDEPHRIRDAIFNAGQFRKEHQVRDALAALALTAGFTLR